MGAQNYYIYWAAGVIGGAIIGFIVAYCLIGILAVLIILVLAKKLFFLLVLSENFK